MENTLPPADILTKFQVCAPVFVEQTQIATIWKVRLLSGAPAALKIYNQQDMKNERTGFAFIEALAGDAAVKLLGLSQGEALLEWLDGPSLGDLTRSGQDQAANAELIRVAVQIHSLPRRVTAELPKLTDWFDALFQLEFDDTCPAEARRDIVFCQQTAQNLLA
ncbi:MAG: hypothetical protein JKX69_14280, partial [Rhodobacteraceae bacterium]|nr:hypothetical protein [Paracoccaceae bacterium]